MTTTARKSGGNRWKHITALDRLRSGYTVDPVTGCWVWGRYIGPTGYGMLTHEGRRLSAHHASYLMHKGPVPEGLELDHLCRNRACVNPAHLEPVTRGENLRRGNTFAARKSAQTHCKRDHEFTVENTYVSTRGERGERICRKCKAATNWGRKHGLTTDDVIYLREGRYYGHLTIEDVARKVAAL